MVVMQSWGLLKQDKEILWFPILSSIVSIIAFVTFALLFFVFIMQSDINAFNDTSTQVGTLDYVVALVYYTMMFFIVNFFQAGIYIIAHGRMNGSDLTFSDGIRGAQQAVGKIFVWSLISATVGVVLRAIADRSKLIGKIIVALLGAAWNILTYFSLPALVIGKASVLDSFKVSATTIRKTWGETIIINIGVGLFFGLITFFILILGVVVIIFAPIAEVVFPVIALTIISMICISVISSALGAIFKLALYEYAQTGKIPQGFSQELIENAVKVGK